MASYTMKIKLLSDLCVSDGGVYNSALDTDICKDVNGFPYIPAKRIKGCLRESAQELADWGADIDIDQLFGGKGNRNNAGLLRISNAVLEDSITYADEIIQNEPIYHPQHILELYSYVRTQTAIDRETGTAEENSLRTMRVADKGLVFVSDVTVDEMRSSQNASDIKNQLEQICWNLTHMGIARTRGFGEVSVSLEESQGERNNRRIELDHSEDNAEILEYELYLEEPVICKNAAGNIEDSNDYIEGSKILGIIASRYRNKYQKEITNLLADGVMRFSNAYIAKDHCRFTEVPAYIYSIKNNKDTYVNKLNDRENSASRDSDGNSRQLNQMKHSYIQIDAEGRLQKVGVELEKRYHHRRPADKSIGRAAADASGDSEFYQISSICRGQSFKGFIKGSAEQIRTVAELLCEDKTCHIGYGSSAEYGRVTITYVATDKEKEHTIQSNRLLCTLISPAVVYNDKAMYSAKVEDLADEILAELGVSEERKIKERFIKYSFIGGYNVTWNMRKPLVQAFDKGTALVLEFAKPVELIAGGHEFLGERCVEGLGEFTVDALVKSSRTDFTIETDSERAQSSAAIDLKKNILANRICGQLFLEYFRGNCVTNIKARIRESDRATVSNMMLMCKENAHLAGVRAAVKQRYGNKSGDKKQEKDEIALKILDAFENEIKSEIESFEKNYHVCGFQCEESMEVTLLNVMLQQIKYAIRNQTNDKKEGSR